MRTFDLTPLYRTAIGFDRLAHMLNSAEAQPSYPPYNVELVSENEYRIVMALAGFDRAELDINTERDSLVMSISERSKPASAITMRYSFSETSSTLYGG